MRRLLLVAVGLLTLAVLASPAAAARWTPYDRPETNGIVTDKDVKITMRDGVELRANIQRPDKPGRYPVLLMQTPYGKDTAGATFAGATSYLVARGYVQILVDVRGTGVSGGTWDSFGPNEQRDGYDLVRWAVKQSWSDGKVGTDGPSYMGIMQLLTAAQHPPGLKAIFPIVPMADGYRDITFSGGETNVSFIPLWLGLVTAASITPPSYAVDGNDNDLVAALTALASHSSGAINFQAGTLLGASTGGDLAYDGPFWKTRSPLEVVDRIHVPAFIVGGLHDLFQRGEPLIYERLKRHVTTRLLMGPWTHLDGSTAATLPGGGVPESLAQIELRWFDHWLKGMNTHLGRIPNVTQWRWGDSSFEVQRDWPDRHMAPTRLYMRGGKALSPSPPTSAETPQTFPQQPVSGICTESTSQWTAGLAGNIPCTTDDRPNEALPSAQYDTPVLQRDLHIDGPILADLWLTTTAKDSAITVRVTDVSPSGASTELTAGWLAASFRAIDGSRSRYVRGHLMQPWHPFTKGSVLPVVSGKPMELPIEVFSTNARIAKGHRLRITVSPADFPHQLPPLPQGINALGGIDDVLTEPGHASFVELPGEAAHSCAVRQRKGERPGAGCRQLPVPKLIRG
ncbi:MAG: CocE/NonD family hydrolase [Actinobacteria bacterium]|nr:CocE/NonD family hydrolase [Actinomycetota bacterium]